MAADEVSPRAYAPIPSSGTVCYVFILSLYCKRNANLKCAYKNLIIIIIIVIIIIIIITIIIIIIIIYVLLFDNDSFGSITPVMQAKCSVEISVSLE